MRGCPRLAWNPNTWKRSGGGTTATTVQVLQQSGLALTNKQVTTFLSTECTYGSGGESPMRRKVKKGKRERERETAGGETSKKSLGRVLLGTLRMDSDLVCESKGQVQPLLFSLVTTRVHNSSSSTRERPQEPADTRMRGTAVLWVLLFVRQHVSDLPGGGIRTSLIMMNNFPCAGIHLSVSPKTDFVFCPPSPVSTFWLFICKTVSDYTDFQMRRCSTRESRRRVAFGGDRCDMYDGRCDKYSIGTRYKSIGVVAWSW